VRKVTWNSRSWNSTALPPAIPNRINKPWAASISRNVRFRWKSVSWSSSKENWKLLPG